MPSQTNNPHMDTSANDSDNASLCGSSSSEILHCQGDCSKGPSTRSKLPTEGPDKQNHHPQTGYGSNQTQTIISEFKPPIHRNSASDGSEETRGDSSFEATVDMLGIGSQFEPNPAVGISAPGVEDGYPDKIAGGGILPVSLEKADHASRPVGVGQDALPTRYILPTQNTTGDGGIASWRVEGPWFPCPVYILPATPTFFGAHKQPY
jgi:hypothetical protein